MKLNKIVVSVLLAVLMLSAMVLPAMAVSPGIDVNQKASLNVRILETGTNPQKGVPGGVVEVYQLTSVIFDPYSGYYHKVCPAFSSVLAKSELEHLDTLSAAEKDALAARALAAISEGKLSSDAQAVPDALGNAKFTDLELGLYLVVQTKPATRYTSIAPFLITLPQYSEDGSEVLYSVDASPKAGTVAPIPVPPPPVPPVYPVYPSGGLPQTGQLWWPVYVLAGAGMLLFLFGWIRRREDRNA